MRWPLWVLIAVLGAFVVFMSAITASLLIFRRWKKQNSPALDVMLEEKLIDEPADGPVTLTITSSPPPNEDSNLRKNQRN